MLSRAENAALDRTIVRRERKGRFVLFSELEAESCKDWLVHNFLGAGEASAFYGKPGDGKSVLAEDLDLHVAAGLDWHGCKVKQGAVVYIALERRKLVERRAIAFRTKHGLADLPFAIVGGVYDFRERRTAEAIAEIVAAIAEETGQPVVLIVIDTLSRALCGGDENSPKDMGAVVSATSVLQAKAGAHVLWVHHIPADGNERLRGHGALLGALDTTICVAKPGGTIRGATVVKANDSEEGECIAFTLESVTIGNDGTTAPVVVPATVPQSSAGEPRLTKNQQTMFSLLYEAGSLGLTVDQWNEMARSAGLGINRKADLHDFRSALKAKGLVACLKWRRARAVRGDLCAIRP